jgi:hypothetical protein
MIVMIGVNIKRISTVIFVVFACFSLLYSQSLVEIAKKEKERRAALKAKGITSIVVTNADLNKPRRLQMIAAQPQDTSPQGRTQARQQTTPSPSTRTTSQRSTSDESQSRDVYGYRKNATKVIFSTGPVTNPDFALNRPDDKFTEISEMGVLDLEFSAKNGPGADIAIYARMATQQETASGENEEGGVPIRSTGADPLEGFWYGVLVMDGDNEWQEIGRGSGMNSPEEFDLGDISEVKKIRIMFKSHNNPTIAAKLNTITDNENTVGIDAVEALH